MRIYNIAERNRALWLANTPEPFASRLHADVSLFTFLQQSLLFFSSISPVFILKLILSLKSWKHQAPLLDMRTLNYQISTLTCSANLGISLLRDLQIWASRSWIMVEQRHSEKTTKTTNWSVSTFRGKPSIVTIRQCFPSILWHTT